MIQRFLFTAISTGYEAASEDPEIFDNLFKDLYELTTAEMEGIKTYFSDNPLKVAHSFPRTDDTFPRVSIILKDDNEGDAFLDDHAHMIDDEDDEEFGCDVRGSIWNASFQLICSSENKDATIYLYELIKDIIYATIPYLKTRGVEKLGISGSDLMLDQNYMPAFLFTRQITFRCRYEFLHTDRDSRYGKAWQVVGIHVNDGRESSVKKLITPYSEEE